MPENPIKPVGTLKPINEVKPVGELKPISSKQYKNEGINLYDGIYNKETADNIIDGLPEMPGDTESKKGLLKDLVKRGGTKEEISESLLALQGKHTKQDGGYKYYIDERGVAKPLANNEKPPRGYDVASLFGSQKDAENDNPLTSTAKHVWNGLIGAAEGVVSLPETVQGLATGNESTMAQTLKNAAQYLKFNTKTSEKEQLFNAEGMNKMEDVFDPERWTPKGDNIQGQILNGLESVISFAVGRGAGAAKYLGKNGSKVTSAISAYNMSLNSMLDTADEAGLTGRDKYAFAGAASIPQALLEGFTGVGGLLTKNSAAKTEFNNLAKIAAKNLIRDAEGNLTKESLDILNKEMTVAATHVAKKYAGQVASTVGEEALTETAQQFAEESSKQLYDKLKGDPSFNADALSFDALGKYINSAIGGALGAVGPSAALNIQTRNIEKDKAQKESVFELVKKGEDAVKAFKQNIYAQKAEGNLTPEEADNALLKVESYNDYNRLINNKGLNFDDEQKREIFDKTFQKENLETRMKNMGDINKLNPIDLAEYNSFHKQSNDLQKDLNELILKSQIKQETTAAKKTITDIAKSEEKPSKEAKQPVIPKGLSALADKYKKIEDARPFDETPAEDFNKKTNNARDNFDKTVKHLEKNPTEFIYGNLTENPFTYKTPNETYAVELPDGKKVRFSSSMTRDFVKGSGGFKGHFRQEHFSDKQKEELLGHPMAMKLVEIKAVGEKTRKGKDVEPIKAIKIIRADTGKFIGWAKATNTGSTDVSEEQAKLLEDEQFKVEIPPSNKKVINTPVKPLPVSNVQSKLSLTGTATPTKEEFVSEQINNLLTAEDADVDQDLIDNGTYKRYFENQYDKTYGKTTNTKITEQTGLAEGNSNQSNTETTSEADRTETTLKKPRTKDLKIKDASRIKALKLDVFTPYEKVMQYFIGGGTLNSRSFRSLYQSAAEMAANKPLGELKNRQNYVKPSSKVTIDSLAHNIWEQNPDLKFDVTDYKNAVEEVLNNEPASVIEMAERLLAKNNITNTPQEQELVDVSKQAEANDLLDEFNTGVEALEQYTDASLNSMADENIELPEDIIRNEDMEDQFQKRASVYGDVQKVVKHIQSVLPKIKVKYDENLGAAGKLSADGKTISINPLYAGIDTPIHEAGHVLIDAMGYNDVTIQKAIKQLEKSKLWKEIKARYPELNNEMLGKEVLAEAIGREGAGIFEKESNISKFQKLLDKIFQWFKDNLGLERNQAKALAKQILRGEVSDLAGTNTGKEQFQKESSLADDLREINDYLKGDLSAEEREQAEEIKSNILEAISDSPEIEQINDVLDAESLEEFTLDELIEVYNNAQQLDDYDGPKTKAIKERIAYYLNENGKEVLRKNEKFVEEEANKKDLSWKDVNFKVLSHMTSNFPELQQLSPLFDEAYFNKVNEANTMKRQLEKLAKAVIKEHNQKLGLSPQRVVNFFSSDNAKYFNYLDNNGKLIENTSGLSKSQKDLLDYMKDLVDKKQTQVDENGDYIENEILKIDPTFAENFKTEGLMTALSNYFGGGNLVDVKVTYTNPNTKQAETVPYLDAQKEILSYSKGGLKEKVVALAKLLAIAYKAKKNSGKSAYGLNYKGGLTNKFDKPRNKDLGYSKDFYRAAQMFIDDYTHVKHMSKFVPIVNSLDYLYSKGYGDVLKKPNAKKWLDEWSQAQIFQTEKTTDPIIDSSLKFLRTLTSMIVMGFNLSANLMNVAIGTYNTWRAENLATILKGNKRLFGNKGLNKYGIDLLSKYNVVNMDIDSNPGFSAGKLFERIAFAGQQYGEMQIQGSAFLGKLSDKTWNSFEYNKDGELVLKKDADEKAVTKEINEVKNEITDIQGKYSAKDRRNFARGEFGKNLAQFKTWMPDWWRVRYGAEYIDGNGVTKRGTWNMLTKDAIAEIKKDFSKENNYGFKIENGIPMLKNKQIASNLKGMMAVAFLLSLTYGDDEDKKKRKQAISTSNALGNLLFIFDIDQMKYTIKNPVASIGTINKFIEVTDDIIKMDSEEFMKDAKKVVPYNKLTDVPKQVEEIVD